MEDLIAKYQPVIGLEVHAQLLTRSKMYSSDENEYGVAPNTNLSVITLGHPGTLPKVNRTAVEFAMKMGLATNCQIRATTCLPAKTTFTPTCPRATRLRRTKPRFATTATSKSG